MGQISGRFALHDPARNVRTFILGVISTSETKNCWTMAEPSGQGSPDKSQRLLCRAKWAADDSATISPVCHRCVRCSGRGAGGRRNRGGEEGHQSCWCATSAVSTAGRVDN